MDILLSNEDLHVRFCRSMERVILAVDTDMNHYEIELSVPEAAALIGDLSDAIMKITEEEE